MPSNNSTENLRKKRERFKKYEHNDSDKTFFHQTKDFETHKSFSCSEHVCLPVPSVIIYLQCTSNMVRKPNNPLNETASHNDTSEHPDDRTNKKSLPKKFKKKKTASMICINSMAHRKKRRFIFWYFRCASVQHVTSSYPVITWAGTSSAKKRNKKKRTNA